MLRRNLLAVVAALAAIAAVMLMAAGGAGAQITPTPTEPANGADAFNPQTTNVPYVAWAGEQIRFMKCYTTDDVEAFSGLTSIDPSGLTASYSVVNPLIDTPSSVNPTFEGGFGGVGAIVPTGDGFCASGTYYSASPGLADILLVVQDGAGHIVVPKHDFIGIWLRMNAPTIAEVAGGGDNGTGSFNLGSNGGAPVKPGIVGISVTGSFTFGGVNYTFPGTSDWSNLAHMLATDTNAASTSPGSAWYRWDIHDNNAQDEGHPLLTPPCTPSTASGVPPALDAVDNCIGGTNYSRIVGYDYLNPLTMPKAALGGSDVGPYDPLWEQTLLGNGVVDQYDVPMPAAQIDVTMTGDVGSLMSASKQMLLSRDGTGADTPHNLYAPYYSQYIPATSRGDISSGVDGPQNINDVAGFQTYGLYRNWDILNGVGATGMNNCLTASGDNIPEPGTGDGSYVSGTVYTDEHGNAEVLFNPNGGFNLSADANNRCAAFVSGPTTFTSQITATAVYPYKKVAPAQTTAPLTKTVATAALKSLACTPKGLNEAFCVETVHDAWGNPVVGAPVKFTANSTGNANLQPDAAVLGGFDTTGQGAGANNPAENFVIVSTNRLGEAGVAITDSLAADCVNLRAENLATSVNGNPGVSVFTDFDPATGAVCTAGPIGVGGDTGTGGPITPPVVVTPESSAPKVTSSNSSSNNSSSSNSSSNSSVSAQTSTPAPASTGSVTALNNSSTPAVVSVTAHKASVSISIARFMFVGHSRFLGVRLASTAKTAKVNITLIGRNGRVIGHVVRTVKTNRLVRVMKVGAKVKSVRVAALSL